jgi:hypothetical protein
MVSIYQYVDDREALHGAGRAAPALWAARQGEGPAPTKVASRTIASALGQQRISALVPSRTWCVLLAT